MISLKAGLGWLLALALGFTLLINLGIQIIHAGPRVRAEAGSNLRLTREFVLKTIASLPENENPLPALQRLYANLGSLRHVDIAILVEGQSPPAHWSDIMHDNSNETPAWFVNLIGASPRVITVPITVGKAAYGSIAIISNPLDELQEIWSDMIWLASISLIVTLVILVLVLFLLRYSLAPFAALQEGLAGLEAGKTDVRIQPRGASEFRVISNALNSLAVTLDRVRRENHNLVSELIKVQESERKEIARDLHDEAGPCLFSIRAAATALQELLAQPTPNLSRLRENSAIMDRASEALQTMFRGLLGRLRPTGLAELGLDAALRILVASWRLRHPEVDLRLATPHDLTSLDEATAFAAYRVTQEGVTNIFRHAGATRAQVVVQFGDAVAGACDAEPALEILIEDDGAGIPENHRLGLGILGMRERVEALGGRMCIERVREGGTRVSASLPIREESDET